MENAERPVPITPEMLLSRRVDFERRMRRAPPLTVALIAVLAVIFAGEAALGALRSPGAIVAAGALAAPAVAGGEYWRLVSATFLHGSLDHLVSNAIALLILGMICEHAFGRAQFLSLYVLAGVAGSLLSLAASPGPSVGASGAIFGLQGASIVLFRRHRDRLLVRDRRIGVVMLVWAVYTIVAGLMTPYIDNGAHIGGALGGALIARRLHPVVLDPMPPTTAARVRLWLWLVGALLVYTAVGWTLSRVA
ncbi:MAG: rhomboid family intramembrane serine protease [Candidatus Rokubacteria bacterium]|nr:rhomboid family intramembrane serine protease [Candidatus Rokubacteria bacterium]